MLANGPTTRLLRAPGVLALVSLVAVIAGAAVAARVVLALE